MIRCTSRLSAAKMTLPREPCSTLPSATPRCIAASSGGIVAKATCRIPTSAIRSCRRRPPSSARTALARCRSSMHRSSLRRSRAPCGRWRRTDALFLLLELELRDAELPFQLVQLAHVDRTHDVHDSELARLARDDGQSVRSLLLHQDVDVDVLLLLATAHLDQPLPTGRIELLPYALDVGARIGEVLVELVAADI